MVRSVHSRRTDPIKPHGAAVDLISIVDQVNWSFIPGKCLRDLMCDPLCGRMRCYVEDLCGAA
jgi:hypothetical protein